jgi:hypothetical protein
VRRLRSVLAVSLLVPCAFAAGCGGSGSPIAVQVAVTAPVDGATVAVPGIVVLGTIEPKDAHVVVSGKHAQVTNGTFKQPLSLHARHTQIEIVGTASGFLPSKTILSVIYDPSIERPRASAAAPAEKPPAQTPAPGSLATDGYTGGDLPSGSGAEADFVGGCSNDGASVAGCLCMWHELTSRGFNSEAQWEDLIKEWRRSFAANGVIAFPPAFKAAILACAPGFR